MWVKVNKCSGFCVSLEMIIVAVGIIIENSRVLLCQRKKTARYPLMWEFPGGKIEAGESPEAGLIRELKEELFIESTIGSLYFRQSYDYPDSGSFDVLYYSVSSYTGTMHNMVFESTAWVEWKDLLSYDILEGNREVVRKLMAEHGPKR